MSAVSTSVCELTETYSPAAIDKAPAVKPANVASRMGSLSSLAVATPIAILAVDKRPSLAPSTAALIQLLL